MLPLSNAIGNKMDKEKYRIVREQDFESAKAACAALKWVLQELDNLEY